MIGTNFKSYNIMYCSGNY